MKEAEHIDAVNSGDEHKIELNNEAVAVLKKELAATVKEFNSIPIHSAGNRIKDSKKRWWQKLFQFQGRYQ